jgi:hypothetical protein
MIPAAARHVHIAPRSRRICRRTLGWLALAAAAPLLFACNARSLEAPTLVPSSTEHQTVATVINRDVDLLFLIDDSASMAPLQANLLRNFPVFMSALKALPGGLPNVHIAVVSSDMGAGDGTVSSCDATGGKNGIFQYTARGGCTSTGLASGATFISDVAGVRNYTGNLEDVFSCIAALGEGGCGFEHQLAAVTRALGADGQAPPLQNQQFLRPDAYLAIVLITNEDDCSAPAGSVLFYLASNNSLASQLGPAANFRCNEFGHLCDGARPARLAPGGDINATQTYGNCVSAEDGVLTRVADVVSGIRRLKMDPDNQIMVASISGLRSPYEVHWKAPTNADTGPWPEISHVCTAPDGSYADPSPRIADFVASFGGNGLQLPICAGEFAPALTRLADQIEQHLRKPCITQRVAKRPGTDRDDCSVVTHTRNDQGQFVDSVVPACADTSGAGPCWQLVAGVDGCTGQSIDVVPEAGAPMPTSQNATVECALCMAGVRDDARGCP